MYSPDQIELQSYFYIFSARPSTASAASRIASESDGCGWQMRAISSDAALNSIALTASAIKSDAQRAAIGREWKLPGLVGAPFPFELLLGIADPGNFGRGINDPGNTVKI